MQKLIVMSVVALCASPALAQPSAGQAASPGGMTAKATFVDIKGENVGTARLTQTPKGVLIDLDVKGLTPGEHGFHIHETGKCETAAKFTTAGGHYSGGHDHGFHSAKGPHAGDLPNLIAPESGIVKQQIFTSGVTLSAGATSLFDDNGSALVIHAKADDYRSQPAGDSGDRVACAVIEK